jgi:CubicO group peptidase (beta-lactamase class C family)
MTKRVSQLFLLVFILMITSCDGIREYDLKKDEKYRTLISSFHSLNADSLLTGFGVGIIRNGKIAFLEGFGFANVEKENAYTPSSIQSIGSVSKLIIGVAMVKAIEMGLFNLDSEINDLLPFEVSHRYLKESKISVKHLATHTSTISDSEIYWKSSFFTTDTLENGIGLKYLKETLNVNYGVPPSLESYLEAYFSPSGRLFDPRNFMASRSGFRYKFTNVGSSLAAFIIENTSGIPFHEFCQKYIFKPLKMKNTSWFEEDLNQKLIASLYLDKDHVIPRYLLATYPDGGLNTTTEDMTVFLSEIMNGYKGKSDFLKSESFQLLLNKQFVREPSGMDAGTNTGLFWDWSADGRIGHNSGDPGIFTMFGFDPRRNSGSILFINQEIYNSQNSKQLLSRIQNIIGLINKFEKGL